MESKKKYYSKPLFTKKKIKINLFTLRFPQGQLLACPWNTTCINPSHPVCCGYPGNPYSDFRLKKDIKPLTNALEKLMQIRGVTFKWNSAYKEFSGSLPKKKEIGFVAQDVEKVFPELVEKRGRGSKNYRVIHYAKITAVLVEAVKELKEKNEFLHDRLSKLEKQQEVSN